MDPGRELPVVEPVGALRGLTTGDLLALIRVLKNWLIMTAAVWIATAVVPGIDVHGGLGTYLAISLIFGLVNAALGPVLQWLAGSLSWLTLGVSALLANGLLFATTAGLSPQMDIAGLGSAVLGAARGGGRRHGARAGLPPAPTQFPTHLMRRTWRGTPIDTEL